MLIMPGWVTTIFMEALIMKSEILTGILAFSLLLPGMDATARAKKAVPVYVYDVSKRVFYPSDYSLKTPDSRVLRGERLVIVLYAREFSQGNAVYAEIIERSPVGAKRLNIRGLYFQGRKVPLTRRDWGCRGLFAIPARMKPGLKNLSVRYSCGFRKCTKDFVLKTGATRFHFYPVPLDLGRYSDMDYGRKPEVRALIEKCSRKKKRVFRKNSPDMLGRVRAHPRDMHYITSPFWAKRALVRFVRRGGRRKCLKNGIRIHRGLDLRGRKGTPVFAMADGRVALAEKMFYEGNFIIIDHGNRVFSYYMHLNDIIVSRGQRIYAGKRIGSVGSTGVSTDSHLHVSFVIRGEQVDPLSILSLPMR